MTPLQSIYAGQMKAEHRNQNRHEEAAHQVVQGRATPSVTSSFSECDTKYPEGGPSANTVVFGGFLSIMGGLGLMNSIGIYQAWISDNQLSHMEHSQIGWIFGMFNFMVFFCGIQIGPVFDALGPRLLMVISLALYTLAFVSLGFCETFWQFFIVIGIVAGAATSIVFVVPVACVGHFFEKKRGAATGIAMCGGSVGGVIFPIIFEFLGPKLGFAWVTRVIGLITIVSVGTGCIILRSRPELRRKTNSKKSMLPDITIFTSTNILAMTTGVFFIEWGFFVGLEYIASYALASGLNRRLSYQLIVFLNAASVPGRALPGFVADRIGRLRTLFWTNVLCMIAMFAIWLPAGDSIAAVVIFAIVFGFASGSNISLVPVCVGEFCDTAVYGRYYTTVYTIVSFGALTGVPIAGAIVSQQHGAYSGLILFAGASYAAGVICFGLVDWISKSRKTGV